MREEMRQGYLYVPSNRGDAVVVYAVEHVTIATPGFQRAKDRHADPVLARRAVEVRKAADAAPAPGLYRARITVNPRDLRVWSLVRGARAGSPLDEIGKLAAAARERREGRRNDVRTLRHVRRARALVDGLRLHVLPLAQVRMAAEAS